MKQRIRYISFIFFASLLISCSYENDYLGAPTINDPFTILGFVRNYDNSFNIITDNNDTLEFDQSDIFIELFDSMRVLISYSVIERLPSSSQHYFAKIQSIDKILYKDIVETDIIIDSSADSLGNDPIEIITIWKTGINLNIEFAFYGNNKIHNINLTRPKGDVDNLERPIELTLQHNANNDDPLIHMKSTVTFSLQSLHTSLSDTTRYKITSTDYYGSKHTFTGSVVFP